MEKQYFKCYELFHKIGKDLPEELQGKYYVALMEYGLYGNEPTDPVIKALLQGPMYSINKSEEISAAKSDYMKGNQNAKKDWNKLVNHVKTENNRDNQRQTEKNTGSNKKNIEVIEDNRSNKKNNINKNKYLDFVYLSEEEHQKLVSRLGEKLTNEMIDKLNNYIGSKGIKYKSHYYTLLNWSKNETVTPQAEWQDDIDHAIQELADKNIKAKMEFEISQRRKNGMNVNMDIFKNILNRITNETHG